MRYIRIKHLVNETGDWRKVYTWEIGAYGAGGRWGLPPTPQQQSRSFRQLMGVNGIWGWGNKSFSDTLVKQVRHLTVCITTQAGLERCLESTTAMSTYVSRHTTQCQEMLLLLPTVTSKI
jgi:hypothetical protein